MLHDLFMRVNMAALRLRRILTAYKCMHACSVHHMCRHACVCMTASETPQNCKGMSVSAQLMITKI